MLAVEELYRWHHKPIYNAFYIQDKFTFKDIIFRLGLRVDRYDANTKVLKDPYSLYEIMQADDFWSLPGHEGDPAASVQPIGKYTWYPMDPKGASL
jgi:hypothetical protein